MTFTGLDVDVMQSILLLCAIIIGGVLWSLLFLGCCKCVEGRAERICEEEYKKFITQNQMSISSGAEPAEVAKDKDDSASLAPVNVPLHPLQKSHGYSTSSEPSGFYHPHGTELSINDDFESPKIILQSNSSLSNATDQESQKWKRLSEFSPNLVDNRTLRTTTKPAFQISQSMPFTHFPYVEFKKWDNNVNHAGMRFRFIPPAEKVNKSYTINRTSSSTYHGCPMTESTSRIKLLDITNNNSLTSSFDLGLERKASEL